MANTTETLIGIESNAGDAQVNTSYRDDNIAKGRIFSYGLIVDATAETPFYFTWEKGTLADDTPVFLLPVTANPVSGYVEFNIYEDTSYSGGTAIAATNMNRNSGSAQKSIVKSAPTTTVTKGTLLSMSHIFGVDSTRQSAGGGSGNSGDFLILDIDKNYLFEFIPSETGKVGVSSEFGEV